MNYEQLRPHITLRPEPHKFATGRVVTTRGVYDLIAADKLPRAAELFAALQRHVRGDWGDVPPEDAARNEQDLLAGERLISSYRLAGHKIWIITEWDRSYTTILFPDEY